jgi:hypothetical protein
MAIVAGRVSDVYVSTNDGTYTQVGALSSVDFDVGYDAADATKFGDYAKSQLPTMSTFSGSASGLYDPADAGQTMVLTAVDGPTLLWVRVRLNGTAYRKCQCAVKAKLGSKVADAVSFEFSFDAAGGAKSVTG